MTYLLDTSMVSELSKPEANRGALDWFESQNDDDLYISVLTMGEIAREVAGLPDGERKAVLEDWWNGVQREFGPRLLPVDPEVARRWGRMAADRRESGQTLGVVDGLLAATAFRHGYALVTRNATAFTGLGVIVLNPWR